MKNRPPGKAACGKAPSSNSSDQATRPQAATSSLRCAGCGAAGHVPTIAQDHRPGIALTIAFDWRAEGRPALVCAECKATAAQARQTGRRRS